ncbi:uncharacterized protein DUF4184 [Actinocorallia herbida]|uniref:Uncharacterized protein DUF4184 n=1 Tax=Actinocorallia herbida TaxID=58109 RepID=A0A3N1CY15_9ACTN|nr:DUF4184 family protein [Actinocorallia herbida]ROO85618.1 uncharacterized protein DUF4184 [Actinocorallia herbida]
MPFTVSHVAAVLPLRRGRLVPSALVVGAMAPDVPLFAPVSDRPATHRARAILTVDLLFGVVLLGVFHAVKRPLVALLPRWVRARVGKPMRGFRMRGIDDAFWTLVSLALGSATHVVWDAFTHEDGKVVLEFPLLERPVLGMPFYRWAQAGSGVFGLVVLGLWSARWLEHAPAGAPVPGVPTRVRVSLGGLVLASATAAALHGAFVREPKTFFTRIPHAVAGAMSAAFCCVLLYAVLWWARPTDVSRLRRRW